MYTDKLFFQEVLPITGYFGLWPNNTSLVMDSIKFYKEKDYHKDVEITYFFLRFSKAIESSFIRNHL